MSPIGRIFIVLNLILSAAFIGWASNALGATEDFKAELEQAKADHARLLEEKTSENSKLMVEKNELSESQRTFREQRDQTQALADRLQGQIDEEKRRNDQLDGQLVKIQASLNDYNQTIKQLNEEKDRLTQRAQEAEKARDDAQAAAQEAELARRDADEARGNAETQIADLEAEKVTLTDKVSELETRLAVVIETTGVDPKNIGTTPVIQASVLQVRYDKDGGPGLVMLNVGKNHDVKRGYTFDIYRGTTYKGQVRVEDVQDAMCSAVIISSNKGTTIAQGDSASTNL